MKRFYSIILSLSLAVCLSSCAYVQKGTGYLSDGGKYVGRQAGDAGRWVGGVFTPKPSSEVADIVVSSKDLADLQQDDFETSLPLEAYGRSVAAQTGGAIEVFSLDGGSGGGVTPVRISPDLPVVHNRCHGVCPVHRVLRFFLCLVELRLSFWHQYLM